MKLIGVSGKIGSGKTVFSEHLVELLGKGWKRISFGDVIKSEASSMFGFPLEWCYSGKDFLVPIDHPDAPCYTMSVRRVLQWWGTDICRKSDPDYWCMKMVGALVDFASDLEVEGVIVDDVRFFNEAKLIKGYEGILIRLAPYDGHGYNSEEEALHASETALDNYLEWDHVLHPEFGHLPMAATEVYLKICQS